MLHSLRKGVKTLIFYVQFDRSKLTLSICKKCLVPVFRPCEMLLLVGTPWMFFLEKVERGVIYDPKNFIADFLYLKQYLLVLNFGKKMSTKRIK